MELGQNFTYNYYMVRRILKFTHPVLRKKAKAVKKVTPQIVKLIGDMIETMLAAPGIGLAAPQIGESIRVIVVDSGEGVIAIINPNIIKKSGKQTFTEGCLSVPGVEAPVERAALVVVEGLDQSGEKIKIEAKDLLATVLQHEIDHLEGVVFIDRVSDPSLIKHMPLEEEKREELI